MSDTKKKHIGFESQVDDVQSTLLRGAAQQVVQLNYPKLHVAQRIFRNVGLDLTPVRIQVANADQMNKEVEEISVDVERYAANLAEAENIIANIKMALISQVTVQEKLIEISKIVNKQKA